HEFGVHARDIDWHMERLPEKSHGGSTGFRPPEGVRITQIPLSTNIGEMLMKGELDGALLYLNEPNLVDRSTADISEICRPLFADQIAESSRYFAKTGVYPINHTMVIKRDLHEKHPWAAVNIYHAFMAAKAEVERTAEKTMKDYLACGLVEPAAQKMFRADPKAYGLRATRHVIETIAQYVHEQGLTDRRVAVEELFAPATLDL
ncbi:MAG TPA: hypothetical protein VIL72_11940, partial [Beijerinckiaceae bacterium]